jgi:Domain of unknown function (DUF4386)
MMRAAKSVGRIIGLLFLVQMVVAPVVNFVLLAPATTAPPGFLANAASYPTQVNVAVLLSLLTGALSVGIAITALPLFRQYSHAMAIWFLALAVISFSGLIVEGIAVRSMLALSLEYAKADAANVALFQAPAAVVRAVRNSAHYTNFLVSGGSLIVFYGVLFRFRLIPRALSAFGLIAVVLLLAGAVIPLLGHRTVMLMFMPIGLSQVALVLWLMTRGFEDRHAVGAHREESLTHVGVPGL